MLLALHWTTLVFVGLNNVRNVYCHLFSYYSFEFLDGLGYKIFFMWWIGLDCISDGLGSRKWTHGHVCWLHQSLIQLQRITKASMNQGPSIGGWLEVHKYLSWRLESPKLRYAYLWNNYSVLCFHAFMIDVVQVWTLFFKETWSIGSILLGKQDWHVRIFKYSVSIWRNGSHTELADAFAFH